MTQAVNLGSLANYVNANSTVVTVNGASLSISSNTAFTGSNTTFTGTALAISSNTTFTGSNITFTGSVTMSNATISGGILANSSYGTAGQLLASNGSSTYWVAPPSTNTSESYVWTNTHIFNSTLTTNNTLLIAASYRTGIITVAANNVDCSLGNYFTKTATGAISWTVSNVPATGAYTFLLELTNGGTGTQTWYTGTKWPGGTAPTLTASGVDVLGFITDDGGTNWRGVLLMKDSK